MYPRSVSREKASLSIIKHLISTANFFFNVRFKYNKGRKSVTVHSIGAINRWMLVKKTEQCSMVMQMAVKLGNNFHTPRNFLLIIHVFTQMPVTCK